MTPEIRVRELLERWEEARGEGRRLTPEELCRDCPELLPEVHQRLRRIDQLLFLRDTPRQEATPETPPTDTTPPSEADPVPAAPTGARYRTVRFHAKGGLGEVYVGHDEELGREVALKRIQRPFASHPEIRRRFLREAEVTGRLEHPGVVPVYGLVEDADGQPCYAMRFIQGDSLHDAIRQFHEAERSDPGARRLALRQLLSRFVAVCNAVAYAHSRGIIHRDLKPANIMLGRYGETLVVDWGLARPVERTEEARASGELTLLPALEGGEGDEGATRVGEALGTPVYMSPEQAAGRWDVIGPASDIYSLGATLYTLLTGHLPFAGKNHAEIAQKVQQGQFPAPRRITPSTPPALQAICLKAMATKPEDRYPTALQLAREVERWLADEPVQAYPEPVLARARRWARRHKPLVTALSVLLLAAVAFGNVGGLWLREHQRKRLQSAEAALAQVSDLQRQERWGEARVGLDEARRHLGEEGTGDLQRRLRQAEADLDLVARLISIREQRATVLPGGRPDNLSADRGYEAAFQEAGLGRLGEEPQAAADRIRDSSIRELLVLEQAYPGGPGGWEFRKNSKSFGVFRGFKRCVDSSTPGPTRDFE